MSEVLEEWIAKAEGDFDTATRELAVTDRPNYDAACYHAQQYAEKYLKALLIARGVTPPKIHDLAQLHRLLRPVSRTGIGRSMNFDFCHCQRLSPGILERSPNYLRPRRRTMYVVEFAAGCENCSAYLVKNRLPLSSTFAVLSR